MENADNTIPLETLRGRRVALGVSGGIAAYKVPLIVRLLKKAGAEVQVVMTRDAERFVSSLTLATVSGRPVLTEIFPDSGKNSSGSWTKHIEIGMWADVFVVAPATAQTIARLAHGFCDSMLTAVALTARCPTLVCPAMDHDMFVHPATQANLDLLEERGCFVLPPEHGELASGLIGEGRLPQPEQVCAEIASVILRSARRRGDLSGKHVVVSAGPTREAIDPVRFISNQSSGKMGYAIAQAAADRGARVTIVSGPTNCRAPDNVAVEHVVSASDMFDAMKRHGDADIIVMAAAVADYSPSAVSQHKIKKSEGETSLHLRRTTDILAHLGANKQPGQILVGFALETQDELQHGRRKLAAKNADLIVVNNPTNEGSGFGGDTNQVTLIRADGEAEPLPVLPKARVAEAILDRVCDRMALKAD